MAAVAVRPEYLSAAESYAAESVTTSWIERTIHLDRLDGEVLLAQASGRYTRLLEPTVWEAVSNLIEYQGSLYAVGSTVYVNHNSGDIYRFDPWRGELRYEAHLFSQDAGQPTVSGHWLYFPAEDSRFSAGFGEYYVTDGRTWRWVQARDAQAFHFHAMADHGGKLYTGAAEWNGLLYASEDRGAHWELVYSHPTPEKRVTRINNLIKYDGKLYAGGYSPSLQEHYLFVLEDDTLRAVAALPKSRAALALAVFQNGLYLQLRGGSQPGLYRFDGTHAVRLFPAGDPLFAAGWVHGGRLYLAGRDTTGGAVFISQDGTNFDLAQRFPEREPLDAATVHGRTYIGIRRPKGRGEIWVSENAAHQGTLLTRRITAAQLPDRLRAHTPPGTAIRYQMAQDDDIFRGPGGDAERWYDWGQEPLRLPQGFFRLKIRLEGDARHTPYLSWSAPDPIPPPLAGFVRDSSPPPNPEAELSKLPQARALDTFWDILPFARGVAELAANRHPDMSQWIEKRLMEPLPNGKVGIFGGDSTIRSDWLYYHYLLMGLALTGHGRVPPALWETPFVIERNPMEKYFSPHEAGVFTAGVLRQNDPETVGSLIALLGSADNPLWFKGDVVGALTQITGQRFGYDFDAWRDWHGGSVP